jgi:hypothetical protein
LGLTWLGLVLFLPPVRPRLAITPVPLLPRSVRRVLHRTPSEEALWQARWYRTRAIQAANQARYPMLESSPPEVTREMDSESWRRRLMASDRTGDLRRALKSAREAAALARTPIEEYQAREWLALIACDAGYHREELQQARRLVELEPKSEVSLTALRRAAECNGLGALARQAEVALNATRIPAPRGR